MNLAAIRFRLHQVGLQPPQAAREDRSAELPPSEPRTLPHRAVMRLENQRLQLRVLRGWVWITRDGCPADLVLGAGEVFEQQPGAPVLVQALEDAAMAIAYKSAGAQDA